MIATSRRGTRAAPEPPSSAPPRSRRGRCSSEARSPRELPSPATQGGGSRSRPVPLSELSDSAASARPRLGPRAGSRRPARVRAGVVGSASLLRVSDWGSSLLSHKLFQKAMSTRRFFRTVRVGAMKTKSCQSSRVQRRSIGEVSAKSKCMKLGPDASDKKPRPPKRHNATSTTTLVLLTKP